MTEEYTIECPKCKSTFDCKEEIEKWKYKILETLDFFKALNIIIESKKEVKK